MVKRSCSLLRKCKGRVSQLLVTPDEKMMFCQVGRSELNFDDLYSWLAVAGYGTVHRCLPSVWSGRNSKENREEIEESTKKAD